MLTKEEIIAIREKINNATLPATDDGVISILHIDIVHELCRILNVPCATDIIDVIDALTAFGENYYGL
jgi:hypothetical protein